MWKLKTNKWQLRSKLIILSPSCAHVTYPGLLYAYIKKKEGQQGWCKLIRMNAYLLSQPYFSSVEFMALSKSLRYLYLRVESSEIYQMMKEGRKERDWFVSGMNWGRKLCDLSWNCDEDGKSKHTNEIPLTSAVMIGLIVANSWKVKPLRMTKFIAHKIQICFATKWMCDESKIILFLNFFHSF